MQGDKETADQGIEVRITLGRKEALEFLRQLARDDEFRRQLNSDTGDTAGDALSTRTFASAAETIPAGEAERLLPIRDAFVSELEQAIEAIESTEPNAADRLREWSRSFARVLGRPAPPEAGRGEASAA